VVAAELVDGAAVVVTVVVPDGLGVHATAAAPESPTRNVRRVTASRRRSLTRPP